MTRRDEHATVSRTILADERSSFAVAFKVLEGRCCVCRVREQVGDGDVLFGLRRKVNQDRNRVINTCHARVVTSELDKLDVFRVESDLLQYRKICDLLSVSILLSADVSIEMLRNSVVKILSCAQ